MTNAITNLDFHEIDLEDGFVHAPGKPKAISHKVLSDTMDHHAKTGQRTRILRIEPGFQSFGQHDHPYWEELLILKGSLYEGSSADSEKKLNAPSFARREPGNMHGPARTDELTYILEVNWYDEKYNSADIVADSLAEIPS